MTYQELKDRLSKCELTLEKIKNGTYSKSNKDLTQTVEKLTILKESLQKQLAEENAILTTKKGASKVVTGLNKNAINKLKQDDLEYNVGFSLKTDLDENNIINLKSEIKKWLSEKVNVFALYKHEYYNKQEDFQFKVGLGVKL